MQRIGIYSTNNKYIVRINPFLNRSTIFLIANFVFYILFFVFFMAFFDKKWPKNGGKKLEKFKKKNGRKKN